tara:strand:- start:95 stop:409 length:315 start_codon:yes stop_codon:yes gene_type:complete
MCCASKELYKSWGKKLEERESAFFCRKLQIMMLDIELSWFSKYKQIKYVHKLYRFILENKHMQKFEELRKFWSVALKKLDYFEQNGLCKRKCAKYRKKMIENQC